MCQTSGLTVPTVEATRLDCELQQEGASRAGRVRGADEGGSTAEGGSERAERVVQTNNTQREEGDSLGPVAQR